MLPKYLLFAVLATLTNICFQFICFQLYIGPYSLAFAMIAGIISGFILKYILDKKFVFVYKSKNLKKEINTLSLYTLMSILTTIIFMGIEICFDYLFPYSWSKYIGAVVGLAVGYFIKFYLDKKFVFIN